MVLVFSLDFFITASSAVRFRFRRKEVHNAGLVQPKHTVKMVNVAERRVPELIPVLGSQPACDVSHKPGGRLPLLFARLAVTLATLKRAATNFAVW